MTYGDITEMTACSGCGLVVKKSDVPDSNIKCPRCETLLYKNTKGGILRSAAYSLTGLTLLWPAVKYPMLTMSMGGNENIGGFMEGLQALSTDGFDMLAAFVFLTAVLVPGLRAFLIAMISIFALMGSRPYGYKTMYRMVVKLEEWYMSDVYLVGILVSAVKLVDFSELNIEKGFYLFCAMVFFTIMMGICFDEKEYWGLVEDGRE